LIETFKLTTDDAHVALEACRRKALEIGVPMDIAVVDDGGSLLSFERMDEALVGGIQIAIDKAYSAAVLGIATGDEAKVAQPGQPEYGINTLSGGKITILAGGFPIIYKKSILGAVGCSSGTVEQDTAVAKAGVSAILNELT
jgi:uncharacterized protein GlcG (DUF336 family)